MVNPWEMTTRYPYNAADTWFVPPESPFLETLTALTFLAGVTERISLGASVIVLPYRHPLFTARVATSIDTLSKGRLILGVGIGWVPGGSEAAQRRAAKYGDAWFSYFVKTTAEELAARFRQLQQWATEAGRDPGSVKLCSVRPIDVPAEPGPQEEDSLRGTPEQLVEALRRFEDVGVEHMALQFHRGRWPERREQIERFGREVIPALRSQPLDRPGLPA